jgi:hypothetical protein
LILETKIFTDFDFVILEKKNNCKIPKPIISWILKMPI